MSQRDRWAREHALLAAWLLLVSLVAVLVAAVVVPQLPREVDARQPQVTCPHISD
jgi:hypothetical protein